MQLGHDPVGGKAVEQLGHRGQRVQQNCAGMSGHIALRETDTESISLSAGVIARQLTLHLETAPVQDVHMFLDTHVT